MNSKVENIDKEQSLSFESDYEKIIDEEDEEKEEMELITLTHCFKNNFLRIVQQFPTRKLCFDDNYGLVISLYDLGFQMFTGSEPPLNNALNMTYSNDQSIFNSIKNFGICTVVTCPTSTKILSSNYKLEVEDRCLFGKLMIYMAVILILKEKCADAFVIAFLDFINLHCR